MSGWTEQGYLQVLLDGYVGSGAEQRPELRARLATEYLRENPTGTARGVAAWAVERESWTLWGRRPPPEWDVYQGIVIADVEAIVAAARRGLARRSKGGPKDG